MENEIECSAIIFSNNSNYAYNLRTKVNGLGINVHYKNTLTGLMDFILDNHQGIIFIDSGCKKYLTYIKKYSLVQDSRNFSFVFLTDNYDINIECDNIFTFKSSYDEVQETLNLISELMMSRKNTLYINADSHIDKCLSFLLSEFNLSKKLSGTLYINDCVKSLLTCRDKKYNILKDIYELVARRYKKNITNIEKSIRLALVSAKKTNPEPFRKVFDNLDVTNSKFINYLVEKIKTMN